MSDTPTTDDDLSDAEVEALHALTLGREWIDRAHGALLEFHHDVGRGMGFFLTAAEALEEAGHHDAADRLRTELLPRGVVDEERWSYDVVESFEDDFLPAVHDAETAIRDEVAGGRRHVQERARERTRKRAAGGRWTASTDDRTETE